MLLTPAQIKQSFESRRNSSSFLPGVDARLCACLGARLLPQSYPYPNLSREGADRVGGQLRGDKECPFSGVTKSGRVWRKVPESNARSVSRVGVGLIGAQKIIHPKSDWPGCPSRICCH